MPSIKTTAIALLLALLISKLDAQAGETAVVTLSCDGIMKNARASLSTKMGLVIDLAEGTVSGFGIVARIESVDAANVSFSGDGDLLLHGRSAGQIRVAGDIDRLTGALSVTATTKVTTHTYEMLCKPVKSLF